MSVIISFNISKLVFCLLVINLIIKSYSEEYPETNDSRLNINIEELKIKPTIEDVRNNLASFTYDNTNYLNSFKLNFKRINIAHEVELTNNSNILISDNRSNPKIRENEYSTKPNISSKNKSNSSKNKNSSQSNSTNKALTNKELRLENSLYTEIEKKNYFLPILINDYDMIQVDFIPQNYNTNKMYTINSISDTKQFFQYWDKEQIRTKGRYTNTKDYSSSISLNTDVDNGKLNYFTNEIKFHIQKNYFSTKKYSLNLSSGLKMNCDLSYRKSSKELADKSKITSVSDKLAEMLMYNIAYICHNSNIDVWFYKICPFSSAYQQLTYLQKHPNGTSYLELWNLGNKEGYYEELEEQRFIRENNISGSEQYNNGTSDNSDFNNKKNATNTIITSDDVKYKAYNNTIKLDEIYSKSNKNSNNNYNNNNPVQIPNSNQLNKKITYSKLKQDFISEITQLAMENNISEEDLINNNELETKPYLVCEGRICKVFNTQTTDFKKNETELYLNFTMKQIKEQINKQENIFVINEKMTTQKVFLSEYLTKLGKYYLFEKYVNVENEETINIELLKEYESEVITIQRKVIKTVGDNIIVLNKKFAESIVTAFDNDFKFKVGENRINTVEGNSALSVSRDIVYCLKCEFLMFYEVGDFLLLVSKNK